MFRVRLGRQNDYTRSPSQLNRACAAGNEGASICPQNCVHKCLPRHKRHRDTPHALEMAALVAAGAPDALGHRSVAIGVLAASTDLLLTMRKRGTAPTGRPVSRGFVAAAPSHRSFLRPAHTAMASYILPIFEPLPSSAQSPSVMHGHWPLPTAPAAAPLPPQQHQCGARQSRHRRQLPRRWDAARC